MEYFLATELQLYLKIKERIKFYRDHFYYILLSFLSGALIAVVCINCFCLQALRLIKYSVAKAGVEFRREMQRHSGVIRQMFHYRGEPDALRGDALNKAVRDTAHEVVAAIFAAEEKQTASEDVNKRIQGFGNTNFEMPLDDRKSFLSEVVELGSASIRQGLNMIGGQSNNNYFDAKGNPAGSYRGPSLRKSLTSERDTFSKNQREGPWTESPYSLGSSEIRDVPPNQDYRVSSSDVSNEKLGPSQVRGSSQEERLLDSITTVGGVRLQPSREAIQRFLLEAPKLDCYILSQALIAKLHSNVWQVLSPWANFLMSVFWDICFI